MGLGLIVISILLLIAFQVFWLRKEYAEQKGILLKEADIILQTTLRDAEDSVFQKKIIESVGRWSIPKKATKSDMLSVIRIPPQRVPIQVSKVDSIYSDIYYSDTERFLKQRIPSDSVTGIMEIKISASSSALADSVPQLAQLLKSIQKSIVPQSTGFLKSSMVRQPAEMAVYLSSSKDTINMKDLVRTYSIRLKRAGVPLLFQVQKDTGKTINVGTGIHTPYINSTIRPDTSYAVFFPVYNKYILKKIAPQIFFSCLLVMVTAMAFIIIYKNMKRQNRLLELKNDFISNITHELKTPIATVGVALEALQNFGAAQNPEKVNEYLNISKNEIDRVSMLVDKVLKISIIEQKQMPFHPEYVDISALSQQTIVSLRPLFEKYNVEFNYIKEGDDFILYGDPVHLTNVINNLIDNAIKYSSEPAHITLSLISLESEIRIYIEDEGLGIPVEYQSKIFEKFFRVPSGDTHNVKGYGLGLSYVWNIIKQHGGNIQVESLYGKGSKFIITLKKNIQGRTNL